jgi:hypothetical protein
MNMYNPLKKTYNAVGDKLFSAAVGIEAMLGFPMTALAGEATNVDNESKIGAIMWGGSAIAFGWLSMGKFAEARKAEPGKKKHKYMVGTGFAIASLGFAYSAVTNFSY